MWSRLLRVCECSSLLWLRFCSRCQTPIVALSQADKAGDYSTRLISRHIYSKLISKGGNILQGYIIPGTIGCQLFNGRFWSANGSVFLCEIWSFILPLCLQGSLPLGAPISTRVFLSHEAPIISFLLSISESVFLFRDIPGLLPS